MTEHSKDNGMSFLDQFPELLDPNLRLRETVENNGWHNRDTVYSHTLSVFRNLIHDLELGFVADESVRVRLNEQLGLTVGKISRRDTLLVAALFHDVAKPDTIVKDKNGQDACPNHEAKSADKARQILTGRGFDEADISRICAIIAYHSLPHGITNPDFSEENSQKILVVAQNLKPGQDQADIFPELMLLGLADTQGSQLPDNNPVEFALRVESYYRIIRSV